MPNKDIAAFYKDHGYAVAKAVIPPATAAAAVTFTTEAYRRALAEIREILPYDDIPDLVKKIDALESQGGVGNLSKRGAQILSGQFPLEVRMAKEIIAVAATPALHGILHDLLGSEELCLHMPPMVRFVLPGNRHAGVPAHQDISYGGHMSDFITVWTPFVAIDEDCGGVIVHDGSHAARAQYDVGHGAFWLQAIADAGFRKIHLPVLPGDVLILNKYLIHESKGNRSDRSRISVDLRFFRRSDRSTKHFLDFRTGQVIDPAAVAAG